MAVEYKLLPHPHQDLNKNPSCAVSSATAGIKSAPSCANAILISPGKPIGRLDLLPAIIRSCNIAGCPKCNTVRQAARFLSKEMMTFRLRRQETNHQPNPSHRNSSTGLALLVKKGIKLVRINDTKIEDGQEADIEHGNIMSILLPSLATTNSTRTCGDTILKIQFTFFIESKETSPESKSQQDYQSPQQLQLQQQNSILESSLEESPALTMPQQFDFVDGTGSNSFESSTSGLLTLQESRSNLSQTRYSYGNCNQTDGNGTGTERVLLSSLPQAELQILRDACGDSEKERFRRNILDIALEDGDNLPKLLRCTYIDVQKK